MFSSFHTYLFVIHMANFLLRWANRSHSDQDWMISNGDQFSLHPDYVRDAHIAVHHDYTLQVVVSTQGGYAHADLVYTAIANTWTVNSHTPHEWGLSQGNGVVTLRCFLEDVIEQASELLYHAEESKLEPEVLRGYPNYQLYQDNTDTTYCSSFIVRSHVEGSAWIRACIKAHPGTSCNGKPWTSNHQDGVIWP